MHVTVLDPRKNTDGEGGLHDTVTAMLDASDALAPYVATTDAETLFIGCNVCCVGLQVMLGGEFWFTLIVKLHELVNPTKSVALHTT